MMTNDILKKCNELITNADALLIGAGAGLSTAAGLEYGGKRFKDNFSDFIEAYQLTDMYSSAFYPWRTLEEKWAYFSRHIKVNYYDFEVPELYRKLLNFVKSKDYFVLTTNGDELFRKTGFEPNRVFAMQGNYGKFQCEKACHNTLYDNKETVFKMVEQQRNFKVPTELLPICPNCGLNLVPHLRIDNYFVENKEWHEAGERYSNFLQNLKNKKVVLLELGVGFNTPSIIRWPFEQYANQFPNTTLIRMNKDNIEMSYPASDKNLLIKGDIADLVTQLSKESVQI